MKAEGRNFWESIDERTTVLRVRTFAGYLSAPRPSPQYRRVILCHYLWTPRRIVLLVRIKCPLNFHIEEGELYFKHNDQLQLPFCHAHRCCFVLRIHSLDTESYHWVGPTGNGHFQDNNNRDQLQLCGDLNMHQWNRQVSWFSKHGHYHDNNYHHDVDDDNGRW